MSGHLWVPQDAVKEQTIDAQVRDWHQLEEEAFIKPLLEEFLGEKVKRFFVGDACEWGPFLAVYTESKVEHNIMVVATHMDGTYIWAPTEEEETVQD